MQALLESPGRFDRVGEVCGPLTLRGNWEQQTPIGRRPRRGSGGAPETGCCHPPPPPNCGPVQGAVRFYADLSP